MVKGILAAITACLIGIFSAFCVSAEVGYTDKPTGGKSVYIAGNPDMYPIEYYDSGTKSYKGILPDLFSEISESTGLDFTYIRSGSKNEQNRLAKNRQAEIISAHIMGDVDELNDSVLLVSFEKKGKKVEVCIGFTDVADSYVVNTVKEAIEKIPDSRLLELALHTSVEPRQTVSVRWLIFGIVFLLVIIAFLVAIVIKNKIETKKNMQNKLCDPLTGIGNEKYFEQNFNHYITPASYSLYYITYFSLNLQRIEKYFSTTETEEIERYAANILSSFAGELDMIARIGSGVFLGAFQCPSEEEMKVRVTELLCKLNDYKDKFLEECRTQFRAGIFHLNSANIPFETALLNSRQAYIYAHQNKFPYTFATDEFLNSEATKSKLQRKLSDAIKNNEFRLYLQFIVDAKSGEIKGAEALSRWFNPEYGVIMPSGYIDAMITSGIIEHLDFYAFEEVCRQLERWSKTDKKHLWISCNFTRATVSKSDFFKRFEEILNKYYFEKDNLVIELTEDSLADNKATAYQNILACKKSGIKIALDDLGSGYSSLRDLCDYPIDMIKIDRHIVAKSITPRGNALICGIIKLAHDLGINVLCEGVETEKENINSKNAGCDYIQGFYYSHVLPMEEIESFLVKYRDRNNSDA